MDIDFVRAAVRGTLALPSVPRVVSKLIRQLRSPDMSVGDLVVELEQEPLLAARTLGIANSPYYAGRRGLASLYDAVVVVGTDTLRTLVISCGLEAAFVSVPGVNLRQFWMDSTVSAQTARALALLKDGDGEAAYLAGLLHNVGHLILCQAFPEALPPRLSGARVPRGAELAEIEREVCGFDHALVGAVWLDELGFPHSIVNAVAHHLDPYPRQGSLAVLLALATQVATSVEPADGAGSAMLKIDAGLLAASSVVTETSGEALVTHLQRIADGGVAT